MATNLTSILIKPINSVLQTSSALQGYESPLVINFLNNFKIDTFLQKVASNLLEAAFLPELGRIIGTSEDDFLSSSKQTNQQIFGLGGNDTLFTGAGNDILVGGKGKDILNPGFGDDIVIGEDGDDEPRGNFGDDILFGGKGIDFLNGGPGSDFMDGGPGNDILFGNGDSGNGEGSVDIDGNDILIGRDGDDTVVGEEGNDILFGDNGDDTIFGSADDDLIFGGSGNDRIGGGPGNNIIYAGKGNDIAAGADGIDYIDAGSGNDLLLGFSGNDTLLGGSGDDKLVGVDSLYPIFGFGKGEIDSLTGGQGRDTFVLGDEGNVYYNDNNPTTIGTEDYALITDFNPNGVDKIQLSGSPTDYFLDASPSGLAFGTAIFFGATNPLPGEPLPELISIVQGVTLQNLDLGNPNQFIFVA